jgi:hypothetical protein
VAAVAASGGSVPPRLPPGAAAGEVVLYGHVRSLARTGRSFRLRFDPALWLSGTTANRAAIEDGAIAPDEVVPNDYYIRDETHRLLTFRVRARARARVRESSSFAEGGSRRRRSASPSSLRSSPAGTRGAGRSSIDGTTSASGSGSRPTASARSTSSTSRSPTPRARPARAPG